MAPRRKKVDPNDVVIDVDVPPLEDAGSAVAVVDEVAKAVAALEEKVKTAAVAAREKDVERIGDLDAILGDIGESLKRTKWDEVPVKDKAIAFGILTDKRGKILDDMVPQRKEARKKANQSRTVFKFNFATQTAEVHVDGDGEGE
jgi:hypothetical protein